MPDAKASSDDQAPEILRISGTGCIGSDIFEINVSTNIDNIKVSSRIAEILSETAFSFSPNEYISIHRKLFQGISFKIMANPYLRRRQYENNGSVLQQIFKDAWVLCNQ